MSGLRLAGKTILVNGAATGVGRATARMAAVEGANLALTDINGEGLELVAEELRSKGAGVVTVVGDSVDGLVPQELVTVAESTFGYLNVLVNNVGIIILKSLEETTREDFDRMMSVNCYSHLAAIQATVPAMRRSGGGSIVNVASVGALVALPNVSMYCPSKSAVLGLTRAAAAEFSPDIRVNAVCPGGTATEMSRIHLESFDDKEAATKKLTGRQMIARYAQPEEIASVIVFLASDESSFMTGATVAAEGGHSAW
jgi:cyclopentanol dehydrogenase